MRSHGGAQSVSSEPCCPPYLASCQLRAVPVPDYDADDGQILATLPKGTAREFRSGFSLTGPGMSASFKVYIILTTGNEAGSESVSVTRPWYYPDTNKQSLGRLV